MQSYTNGMIGAGEADPNEGVSRKPFRRSFTAPEDQEVEIFQAKNFLMAIFVGSDAESVINNGAIERRLGYYIFEIFAAINSNKGSIRYAPFHFTSSTSSTATSSSTTTQTSKKSFYPSPLEVRKFIFLRQISLFPWHFPLSRITLPTHVGFHLVGTTAKQETVQLFFLLPQRDTDLVLRAFETAFPRNYRDFLQTPSPLSSSSSLFSSSAAAQSLSLSKESSTTVDEISQIQQRHNCAAPLWQQDAIKVSFYHIRTSAWSAWQWCSVRIHQFYPAPIHNLSGMNHIHSIVIAAPLVSSNIKNSASGTQQTRNNLMSMLISSPTGQQQSTLVAAKQKRLDVAGREEEFFLPKIDLSEGQLYAGKEQRYFLYNVSLCLADVAVARRNSLKKRNSIKKNKFNQNNKLNRKLFTDDDETRDEAKHAARSAGDYGFFDAGDEEDEEEEDFTLEKTVLRIRCQQLLPSLPSSITAPINASGSVDVTRISQTGALCVYSVALVLFFSVS